MGGRSSGVLCGRALAATKDIVRFLSKRKSNRCLLDSARRQVADEKKRYERNLYTLLLGGRLTAGKEQMRDRNTIQ